MSRWVSLIHALRECGTDAIDRGGINVDVERFVEILPPFLAPLLVAGPDRGNASGLRAVTLSSSIKSWCGERSAWHRGLLAIKVSRECSSCVSANICDDGNLVHGFKPRSSCHGWVMGCKSGRDKRRGLYLVNSPLDYFSNDS